MTAVQPESVAVFMPCYGNYEAAQTDREFDAVNAKIGSSRHDAD